MTQYVEVDRGLEARLLFKQRAIAGRQEAQGPLPFRAFMESPWFCKLELSPVIAAIADASEGLPVHLDDATCVRIFGCEAKHIPKSRRLTVVVRAGGRGGKSSRLLATKAIHAAWETPLPTLQEGEHARALIIAPDKSLALQDLNYVRGYIEESKDLSAAVVRDTVECITIKRPSDGKIVDITIGAATRGGKAARGRTLVFVGFDEAAFFYADDGYTVTDKEIYRAAIQRIVPNGGQIWIVSTPWLEGIGIMEDRIAEDFGVHEKSLVAVGGTRDLNPSWDPTGEIERDMRDDDPENAAREIDAVPLSAGTKFFFPPDAVKLAIASNRTGNLEPNNSTSFAGVDLGFRRNSSALAIARYDNGKTRLVYYDEKRPKKGEPLKPSEVTAAFGAACQRYNAAKMRGDLHYVDTAKEELAKMAGKQVTYDEWKPTAENMADAFTSLRKIMSEGEADLPNDPRLLSQIRQTMIRHLDGGTVKIVLPKQGQAHGDLLMAVALAFSQCDKPPPKPARSAGDYPIFPF